MIALTRLPHTTDTLVGRETELERLDAAWADPKQHVLVIRGIGGEGKTSLVAEWSNRLAARGYDGASYFDWSFYSQGTRDQAGASSDSFVAAALTAFGGDEGAKLANSAASGRDKAIKLLDYIRAGRTLLILDGLEPLQHPPGVLGGRLRDEAMVCLLKGLAQSNPGLCVVTTREPITDLARFQDSTAPELELARLSDAAGADVLRRLLEPSKPKGVHHVKSTLTEREEIARAVKGHALTLRLLGGFIHKFLRDVRRWREVDYTAADAYYGHAFKTVEAYEHSLSGGGLKGVRQLAVLRLMGLFDRSASGACLASLRAEPAIPGLTEPLVGLSEADWARTLSEVEECGLVAVYHSDAPDAGSGNLSLDAQPLVREYFARRLRAVQPEGWRAAHRRLYEHLAETTKEGARPTLEDLQPLYQAVAHGCHAGLHQEALERVYRNRIVRGDKFYSTKWLGAHGADLAAVACFFEWPWGRVSPTIPDDARAWLLGVAASCLRARGRPIEAVEPLRAGLELRVRLHDWKNAATGAINLSELGLVLGDVAVAIRDAEQAVAHADRGKDLPQRVISHTSVANALHQADRRAEAESLFRQAEAMQGERLPQYPFLRSVAGFQYCDLLLAGPERAAWRVTLQPGAYSYPPSAEPCRAVSARAAETLKWGSGYLDILSTALDHLTLARAALYQAVLEGTPTEVLTPSVEIAVDGLRRAGGADDLPQGLLTRAWVRHLAGAGTGAVDLDEAWEIAERGPMPLFLADVHLHRARLFAREPRYPWDKNPDGTPRGPKDDLAEARRLIEKHSYWRRKEELEDAEAVVNDWPDTVRGLFFLPAHPHLPPGKAPAMTKTVLELDLVGYSSIAATLEEGLDVETSPKLNKQIQDFVDVGLNAVGVTREATVMQTTGDGAILVFGQPAQAHAFAEAVQQQTRAHNAGKPPGIGKRVFRVGIATGELVMEPKKTGGFDIAGMTIARAVRMEAKARPGEVLCDTETFAGLTAEQQRRYSGVEVVAGKRDEKFEARRCVLNPDGVKDAEFFTGPAPGGAPGAAPPKPSPTTQPPQVNRKEVLALFKLVKPHQFDELIFLLNVPIGRRPSETIDLEQRKNALLKWADETASGVENLLIELRDLVAPGDANRPK
jgi:class 3 adenylate cyclase